MQYPNMKFFLSLLISSYFIFTTPAFAIEEIDSVAVVVNENIISKREINTRLADFQRQLQSQGKQLPPIKLLKKQVIERMILDSIQLQLAKTQGIHVDDLTLNQTLEVIAKNNKTTLDKMHKMLEKQGISYNLFREQTRKDMIIRQLQKRMIYSRVKVSQQEIDIFLEQQKKSGSTANNKFHLAHILIATPEAASSDDITKAQKKALEVIEEIKKGESFGDMALTFSDGRHAIKGGDLGVRTAAQLPAIFLKAAQSLEIGEISEPLRSASGFHIIKLLDKQVEKHIVAQTHARHILITADEITTDDAAQKKLAEIKVKLEQGANFEKLAAEFSQDPGSKNNGGDLGWAAKGTFVPRFTEVMETLKDNEISEPFKSQFGWHIIQVLERRQLDETEQVIRQKATLAIQNRKADEELQLWQRRARDEAYVEYRIETDS